MFSRINIDNILLMSIQDFYINTTLKRSQSFTGKTCSPLLHYHCVNHANSCGNAIANSQGLLHAFALSLR